MRILIDIGHPGHVHYFKNLIEALKKEGHIFQIVARDRDVTTRLLNNLRLEFINRGAGRNSKIGKLLYMLIADFKILIISLKFKPDLFLSFSSPYAAQVSFLLGKPHIALTDTEHADKILSKFTYPFSSVVITPNSYLNDLGDKQIRFNGVIEGLYLHKCYFSPDKRIKKLLGLKMDDEYVIIRFVSWNAHHDYGHYGLNLETKKELIKLLTKRFKVFISSEGELPEEFMPYKIKTPPEKMHDVLAAASIFIGESATMASESALLGTKAVYINSLPLMGYLKLEQDFGLLKYFNSSEGVINYVSSLMENPRLKEETIKRSQLMQNDFINPTLFLAWFVKNFPSSWEDYKLDSNMESKFR